MSGFVIVGDATGERGQFLRSIAGRRDLDHGQPLRGALGIENTLAQMRGRTGRSKGSRAVLTSRPIAVLTILRLIAKAAFKFSLNYGASRTSCTVSAAAQTS